MLGLKLNHVSERGPWRHKYVSPVTIWTNDDLLSTGPTSTNLWAIVGEIYVFLSITHIVNISFARSQLFSSGFYISMGNIRGMFVWFATSACTENTYPIASGPSFFHIHIYQLWGSLFSLRFTMARSLLPKGFWVEMGPLELPGCHW